VQPDLDIESAHRHLSLRQRWTELHELWCLAKNWLHLIGNTVMWIDPGIDSGDLLSTERTPLDGMKI